MRIEAITLRCVQLPLRHPFRTSFGQEDTKHAVIVSLHSSGLTGYGEAPVSPAPLYSYETVHTAWHILRDFVAPRLLGQEITQPEQVESALAPVRGHPMAKMGVEAAAWDLLAQARGLSLSRMLGGTQSRIPSGVSIGIQPDLHALLQRIAAFVAKGYRRIKLKIEPGWELEMVHAVRHEFRDVPLMLDANAAFSLDDVQLFQALDGHDLMMIEQPLGHDDLFEHSLLQAEISTPICLDESIRHAGDARAALEWDCCRIINIKPGRVGGLLEARRIHDLCQARGLPVWCGGMLETGIGRAHNVALASLPNFRLPGDISASDRYFLEDIVHPAFALRPDGTIEVPSGVGIGVQVKVDLLQRLTVEEASFKA
jgi:O-succinylbenzoate synthase